MRIISWNCRGLGKPYAVLRCKKKALGSKPDILFLMETWLVKDKGKRIWEDYGFADGWEMPRKGLSGGILLAWMPRQQARIIYGSKNLVHTDLLDNKGNPLSITFVYGHPDHLMREEVWSKLKELGDLAHLKWLCIGDFNQILNGNERFSFNRGRIVEAEIFRQVIFDLKLCELAAFGQKYTWMNNREEEEFVMERLDRAFASIEWIHAYPFYALKNLPIVHSDHGLTILDFELRLPFQFRPFSF
ncbi:uncharacterized protein LOC142612522 [Castanea sativa]|uniref:uncharacterized protein LOC142612522 n=1 Tax=Castanea sativa TaxID=21020 RepID=UPI003F653FBF